MSDNKIFKYEYDFLDMELLDLFLNRFWERVVWPLSPNKEIYISFKIDGDGFYHRSRLILIRNNAQSLVLLKREILGGGVGNYLRTYKSINVDECFFRYYL